MRSAYVEDHYLVEYDVRSDESIAITHSLEGIASGIWPRNRTERVVKHVFEEVRGYLIGEVDTKRGEPLDYAAEDIPNDAKKALRELITENLDIDLASTNRPVSVIEQDGIPDLLAYDDKRDEIIFLEVKSEGDRLQKSQKDWITKFDFIPMKIVLSFTTEARRQKFIDDSSNQKIFDYL